MEFSQTRPCGAPGVKSTHDFLSLYSPAQQDPTPSIPVDYLQTHDFLQPLEQVGKKKGSYIENSIPPSMVEHGGIYSVSHMNKLQSQKVAKADGVVISAAQSSSSNTNEHDEYSNCNSYRETGFTLWEHSKGKTGKENIARSRHIMRDGVMKNGVTWMEQASQSSSIHNNPSIAFSSLSTSHLSSSDTTNPYFADKVKHGKIDQEKEDIDEEFIIKKEPSFHHQGTVSVKVNTTNPDQRSNSPRSKHSATEQRRRSKINDRFSKLRGIIPHGDEKRDKASFLLEVIEYIQFLQEKVHNYEEIATLNNRPSDIFVDEPPLPTRQNLLDSNRTDSVDASKETSQPINEPSTFPDTGPQLQPQLSHSRSCKTKCTSTSDKLNDQELVIESGTICISTIYSQGLSSAITEALTRSGLDLSHANISVQIDLGKRSNTSTLDSSSNHDLKEKQTPSVDDQSVAHSQLAANTWEEGGGKGFKRLKTDRN